MARGKRSAGTPPHIEQKLLVYLIQGRPLDYVEQRAERLGIAAAAVPAVIAECRRKITLAADYVRDEELGRSIRRANDLYVLANEQNNVKDALGVLKELNKLLGLYHLPPPAEGEQTGISQAEAQARAHLAPLFQDGDKLPLHELARLAAQRAINA